MNRTVKKTQDKNSFLRLYSEPIVDAGWPVLKLLEPCLLGKMIKTTSPLYILAQYRPAPSPTSESGAMLRSGSENLP